MFWGCSERLILLTLAGFGSCGWVSKQTSGLILCHLLDSLLIYLVSWSWSVALWMALKVPILGTCIVGGWPATKEYENGLLIVTPVTIGS